MAEPVPPALWRPSPGFLEGTNHARYLRALAERGGPDLPIEDYEALWRWSVDDLEGFWRSIWDHFGVLADGDPTTVLGSRDMPGTDWFPDTRLNYAEHVFRDVPAERVAMVEAGELRPTREITWGELRSLTARIAAGLRSLGVGEGDRVVAYLPNIPEAMAAFLATASLGAIWSSCSPDFGARSVIDRFAQIEPKVLLAVDGYRYGGTRLRQAATSSPSWRPRCRRSSTSSCCRTSIRRPSWARCAHRAAGRRSWPAATART